MPPPNPALFPLAMVSPLRAAEVTPEFTVNTVYAFAPLSTGISELGMSRLRSLKGKTASACGSGGLPSLPMLDRLLLCLRLGQIHRLAVRPLLRGSLLHSLLRRGCFLPRGCLLRA